jgi:hypothetical protein
MKDNKFNLLILEDKETHWDKINNYLNSDYVIYDKNKSIKITSLYCAYKTSNAQHTGRCKTNLEEHFNPILNSFEDNSIICIIDINWNGMAIENTIGKADDKFGIDFYKEYLSQSHKIRGVIITTVGDVRKLKSELGGFENVISKKDDNNHYLTDDVLEKYKNCIDKIINARIEDEVKETKKLQNTSIPAEQAKSIANSK